MVKGFPFQMKMKSINEEQVETRRLLFIKKLYKLYNRNDFKLLATEPFTGRKIAGHRPKRKTLMVM